MKARGARPVLEDGLRETSLDLALESDGESELASFRAALNTQAIVAVTNRSGLIVSANDLFCQISKYSRSELIGQSHRILNSGHHPRSFFQDLWRTIGSGEIWQGEICNRAKDGSLYWVNTTIVPKKGNDGRNVGYVSVRFDITARKLAEAALIEENHKRQEAEILLRDIIEAVPNGIAAYDSLDRLVLFNSAFRECYPLAAAAIKEGATFESILRCSAESGQFALENPSVSAMERYVARRLQEHRNPGRRFIQHLSDGRWLQVQERRSSTGTLVGVRTDVSELKNAERRIKQQAERDSLTGLYNRRVLLEHLSLELGPTRPSDRLGALLVLDLDGFKAINDTYGHDAGDALLVAVAGRLQSAVRKTDIVARLGGDEFAILLGNLRTQIDAERIAQKVITSLMQPFRLGRRRVNSSASMGVALLGLDGSTPIEAMKNADLALYQAKRMGRATFAVCSPTLREGTKRRAKLIRALRPAMARGEIKVALQPQVALANAEHVGFEALARWEYARRPVPALELISVAEEAGLIVPLGYYIIDKALGAVRDFVDLGLRPGRLAINVAAAQLQEPDFCDRLCELVLRHQLLPADIEVEVTEGVVLERAPNGITFTLQRLHDAGISIALDDFGTGYASLTHIKQFSIDRLKIDRSFIKDITVEEDDAVLAKAIISLAHNFGMTVVAEGVETKEQLRFLSNHGCDVIQGYLVNKPLPPDSARNYLNNIAPQGRLWPLIAWKSPEVSAGDLDD